MKIIKFKDGFYSIRRWCFGWQYYDFKHVYNNFWRDKNNEYFKDCKVETFEQCKEVLNEIKNPDYGTPICQICGKH